MTRSPLPIALLLAGCATDFTDPSREFAPARDTSSRHPVDITLPRTVGVVDTSRTDIHGTPIGVACQTCHGPETDPTVVAQENPEDFHGQIELQHGDSTCDSCHAEDRSRLKLADGRTLEMQDALTLCTQCHGPQRRDYDHGAHGGMSGHWDLSQGPRTRNHCLSCHPAHAPAFEGALPVRPPKDRFLGTASGGH